MMVMSSLRPAALPRQRGRMTAITTAIGQAARASRSTGEEGGKASDSSSAVAASRPVRVDLAFVRQRAEQEGWSAIIPATPTNITAKISSAEGL